MQKTVIITDESSSSCALYPSTTPRLNKQRGENMSDRDSLLICAECVKWLLTTSV